MIDTHMISLEGNTHFENNKWCSIKSKNQKEATLNATGNDNTFLHFCFYCKKQHVTRLNNFEEKKCKGDFVYENKIVSSPLKAFL